MRCKSELTVRSNSGDPIELAVVQEIIFSLDGHLGKETLIFASQFEYEASMTALRDDSYVRGGR